MDRATSARLRFVRMGITATILTRARLTDIMGLTGSSAACSSVPDRGMAGDTVGAVDGAEAGATAVRAGAMADGDFTAAEATMAGGGTRAMAGALTPVAVMAAGIGVKAGSEEAVRVMPTLAAEGFMAEAGVASMAAVASTVEAADTGKATHVGG